MTKEEIAKLPTLLDVIDYYFAGEHSMELKTEQSVFKGAFPIHLQKGYFEPLLFEDGTSILLPLSPITRSAIHRFTEKVWAMQRYSLNA